MEIDWDSIEYFKASEFPEDPDIHAEHLLIYSLNAFRRELKHKIIPSPVEGALARFEGNEDSEHYAIGRRSTAVDVFPDCSILKAYSVALQSCLFGGIGIYFDTYLSGQRQPMLHLDLRPKSTIWLRAGGTYAWSTEKDFWYKLESLVCQELHI